MFSMFHALSMVILVKDISGITLVSVSIQVVCKSLKKNNFYNPAITL